VAASTAANATPSTPNQLWIAGNDSLTVYEVDGNLLGTVPVAGGPRYISIPGGFTAYVTTRRGTVVAVDLATRQVIDTLLSGGQFGPMDYDANTGEVYVPDQQRSQLDVLTPVAAGAGAIPREPARVLRLGSAPQSVAITSDGQLGFVALANGQVQMLDIPGRSAIASIAVGGTPRFIITGLYPPASSSAATPQVTPSPAPSSGNLFPFVAVAALAGVLLLGALLFFLRYAQQRRNRKLS
jgi:hypothetical protein